jgi:hypothetical protein
MCPYCGEDGGEPIMVRSREYQGESPHGGVVKWEDEMCSLCVNSKRELPEEAYMPVESGPCPF